MQFLLCSVMSCVLHQFRILFLTPIEVIQFTINQETLINKNQYKDHVQLKLCKPLTLLSHLHGSQKFKILHEKLFCNLIPSLRGSRRDHVLGILGI